MPIPPRFAYLPFAAVEPDDMTFGVENFKSIAKASLPRRPVTLIAGANSSGKSSLLQAVLLFAQSSLEPTVVINGDLVRLGEPGDIIRTDTDTVAFSFEFPVAPHGEQILDHSQAVLQVTLQNPPKTKVLTVVALCLLIDGALVLSARQVEEIPEHLNASQGETVLRIDDPTLPESYILVSGLTPSRVAVAVSYQDIEGQVVEIAREQGRGRQPLAETALANLKTEDSSVRTSLVALLGRFRQAETVERSDAALIGSMDALVRTLAPGNWVVEPVSPVGIQTSLARFGVGGLMPEQLTMLAAELTNASFRVAAFAESVVYLGPLRDDPRFAYPLGHTVSALPVGGKGEFTAAYLLDNAQQRITYGGPDGSTKTGLLLAAVKTWATYLEIAEDINVKPMGKLGHQLGLSLGGMTRDPTAVGVGASQLLPVVVLVLGAPSGATVLLEQPELHLHPKVQSKLGDFLFRARPDVRLVVETHSEYVLTRLRLRLAEGGVAPEALSVLFATQRPSHQSNELHTEFETLTPDALGDFDHWPENFFDSLDAEGVAMARAVNARLRGPDPPEQT
jgi:AAA domain, putative AbiEii toxin, Type IV TA system